MTDPTPPANRPSHLLSWIALGLVVLGVAALSAATFMGGGDRDLVLLGAGAAALFVTLLFLAIGRRRRAQE